MCLWVARQLVGNPPTGGQPTKWWAPKTQKENCSKLASCVQYSPDPTLQTSNSGLYIGTRVYHVRAWLPGNTKPLQDHSNLTSLVVGLYDLVCSNSIFRCQHVHWCTSIWCTKVCSMLSNLQHLRGQASQLHHKQCRM